MEGIAMRAPKTVLVLCLLYGASPVLSQAPGVPVDPSVAVTSPSGEIPKQLAAFSGKWAGPFNGMNTGAYMSDVLLVVETISSATDISVYYAQIGRWRSNYGEKRSHRAKAQIVNGTLEFSIPDSVVIACTMSTNDTLGCILTDAQGNRNRGNFRRIQG
jgi:hypothetical protein